jgi:hypothetical protein
MTVYLQVIEELQNERSVQIFQRDIARPFLQALMGERQQKPEAIAIGGDRTRRHVLLLHQALHEEALE